jgi:hypothetical protein
MASSSHVPEGRRRLLTDIDAALMGELEAAIERLEDITPYRWTKVGIVTRGLELALAELADEHDVDSWTDDS